VRERNMMYGYRTKHTAVVRMIALAVLCLFTVNTVSWALPSGGRSRETATLQVQSIFKPILETTETVRRNQAAYELRTIVANALRDVPVQDINARLDIGYAGTKSEKRYRLLKVLSIDAGEETVVDMSLLDDPGNRLKYRLRMRACRSLEDVFEDPDKLDIVIYDEEGRVIRDTGRERASREAPPVTDTVQPEAPVSAAAEEAEPGKEFLIERIALWEAPENNPALFRELIEIDRNINRKDGWTYKGIEIDPDRTSDMTDAFVYKATDPRTGRPIGYILAGPGIRRGQAHVFSTAVVREWQGSGVWKAMVEETLEFLRDSGTRAITMSIEADNIRMFKLLDTYCTRVFGLELVEDHVLEGVRFIGYDIRKNKGFWARIWARAAVKAGKRPAALSDATRSALAATSDSKAWKAFVFASTLFHERIGHILVAQLIWLFGHGPRPLYTWGEIFRGEIKTRIRGFAGGFGGIIGNLIGAGAGLLLFKGVLAALRTDLSMLPAGIMAPVLTAALVFSAYMMLVNVYAILAEAAEFREGRGDLGQYRQEVRGAREELDRIIQWNGPEGRYDPAALLDFMKKRRGFAATYGKDAGLWEGFSLEQHTAMVQDNFEKYGLASRLPNIEGLNILPLVRFALAVHDVGKPAAVEAGETSVDPHVYTADIVRSEMEALGFSGRETAFVLALIGGDPIGGLIQTEIPTAEEAYWQIAGMAGRAGLPVKTFFEILLPYYTADVCSYEGPRTDYFVEERGSIHPRKDHPHMRPYWALAELIERTEDEVLPAAVFGLPAGEDIARTKGAYDLEFGRWSDRRARAMARSLIMDMEGLCRQITPTGVEALFMTFFRDDECLAEFMAVSLGIEYCLEEGDREGAAERMHEFLNTQEVLQFDVDMTIDAAEMRLAEDWASKFVALKESYIRLTQWDFLNRFPGAGGMILWRSITIVEEEDEDYEVKRGGESVVCPGRYFSQVPYYAITFHEQTIARAYVPVGSMRQTSWLARPRISDDYEPEVLVNGNIALLGVHRADEDAPLPALRSAYETAFKGLDNADRRDLRIMNEGMTSDQVLASGRDIQVRFFGEMKRVEGTSADTAAGTAARPTRQTFRDRLEAVTSGMSDGEYALEDLLMKGYGRIKEDLARVMTEIYMKTFFGGKIPSKPYVDNFYADFLASQENKLTYFGVRSGRITGFVQFHPRGQDGKAVLNWVAVDPAWQGSGIGAALVDHMLNMFIRDDAGFPAFEVRSAAKALTFYTETYLPARSEEASPYDWYLTYEIPDDEERRAEAIRLYGPELAPDVDITVHIHRRGPPREEEKPVSPAEEIIAGLKLEKDPDAVRTLTFLGESGVLTRVNMEKFRELFAYVKRKSFSGYTDSYMVNACNNFERLARTGFAELTDPDLLLTIAQSCGAEAHTAYYVLAEVANAVAMHVRDSYSRNKILDTDTLITMAEREREAAFRVYMNLAALARNIPDVDMAALVGEVLRKDSYAMFREKLRLLSEVERKEIEGDVAEYVVDRMNTRVGRGERLSWIRGVNNVLANGGMTGEDTLDHWRLFLERYIGDFGFLANRDIMLAYRHIATGEEIDAATLRSYALKDLGVTAGGAEGIAQFAEAVRGKKELVFRRGELSEDDVRNPIVAGILGLMTGFYSASWGHGSYEGQDLTEFIADFHRGSAESTPLSGNLKGVEGRFRVARPISDEGLRTIFERYKGSVRHALALSRAPRDEALAAVRARTAAALEKKRDGLRAKLARLENEKGRKGLEARIGRATDAISEAGRASSCAAIAVLLAEGMPDIVNRDGILQSMVTLGMLTEYFSQDAEAAGRMASAADDSVGEFGRELIALEEKIKAGEITGVAAGARKNILKVLRVRLFREHAEKMKGQDRRVERTEVRAFITKGLLGEMAGDIGDACYTSQHDIMQEPSMAGAVIFTTGEGADRELMGSMLILENSIGGEKTWILRATNPGDSFIEEHDAGEFLAGAVDYVKTLAKKEDVRHIVAPVGEPNALSNRGPVISAYDDIVSGDTVHLDRPENFNAYDIQDACRTVAVIDAEDAAEAEEPEKPLSDMPLASIPAEEVRNILVLGETAKAIPKVGETALDLWPLISSVHDRYPDATIYVASNFSGMFMQDTFNGKVVGIPASAEDMMSWGYDPADWEDSKLGDIVGIDSGSRGKMKRFIVEREVDLVFDVSIMSMKFRNMSPEDMPGGLAPHIFAMDSPASMASVSGPEIMREPHNAVYRDRKGRTYPLPAVKETMLSVSPEGQLPEAGTWGQSIAMCRALGLDVNEDNLKVAGLSDGRAIEAMRFVEECYHATHPGKPAGSFDPSKKIVLVNVYAITQSGLMEWDDWVTALTTLASSLKDTYLLFTRGGGMDADHYYADTVSAALRNNGNDILVPRTNLHPHVNEILGISSGLITLDTGMSHIGNGIYGVPTAIITTNSILHWLPPRDNVTRVVIPSADDLRLHFLRIGGDYQELMEAMRKRKREMLEGALRKYAEDINSIPDRPEVRRAKSKFLENRKREEEAGPRALRRGDIVYGYFMPSTGRIKVDIAKTRSAFSRVAPGLDLADRHKVTGFVHAHEIFHLLMDRAGVRLEEEEEDFLADAFAKRALGLDRTEEEERSLDELSPGIADEAVRKQLRTPYESPEFLLNLVSMGIDIYDVEGGKITAVPEGARTMSVPEEGDKITGPFRSGDIVYNAEVTFDPEEILAEVTAWLHARGAGKRYFSEEQWLRAIQRNTAAGHKVFLAKLVSEDGEVIGVAYSHKAPFTFITDFGVRSREIYQGDLMEIADGYRGQGLGEVLLAKTLDIVLADLTNERARMGSDDLMEVIQSGEEDAQGIFVVQPAIDREYAEEGRRAVDFFHKNGFRVLEYPAQERLPEEDYDHTLFMAVSRNRAERLVGEVRNKTYTPPEAPPVYKQLDLFPPGTLDPQMGKRARVTRVHRDGAGLRADVKDHAGRKHELAMQPRGRVDISKLKRRIKYMHDVSRGHKQLLLDALSLLENSPPEMYVFDDLIEDLFGFASPGNGAVALYSYFADDPVAVTHEALEYITHGRSRLLRLKFKGGLALWAKRLGLYAWLKKTGLLKGKLLIEDGQGNSIGELPLEGEALSIALKGVRSRHYLLRALQREVFGDRDRRLTTRIKDIQSGTTILERDTTSEMWTYVELEDIEPMQGVKRRLVTAGDIHGELQGFREILEGTGLIKRGKGLDGLDDEWTGGDAILVQGGDVIDRGPESMQAMYYLRYLKEIAEEKGGEVVRLMGNHELMYLYKNDSGKWKETITRAEREGGFNGIDGELWNNDSELVAMIREDVLEGRVVGAYELGGKVFVHGVAMPELLDALGRETSADVNDSATFAATVNDILRKAVEENSFDSIIFSMGMGVIDEEIEGISAYYLSRMDYREINKLPFDEIVFHDSSWFKEMGEILVRTAPGTKRTVTGGDVGMTGVYGGGMAAIVFEDGKAFAAYPDSRMPQKTVLPAVDVPEPPADTGRPLDSVGVPSLGESLLAVEAAMGPGGQEERPTADRAEAEKTIKGTAARRRALFPRTVAYLADTLKAARDKGEDLPIDVRIDLSLIPPNDLQANMDTWAYLILACAEAENVNFVFEALDMEGSDAYRQETAALYALERALKENAYLTSPGTDVGVLLRDRVALGRRKGAIEILLWRKTRLERMSQERRRGKTGIELSDEQYPVALDDAAFADLSGERLMNFEAAVTVGLCVAALAVARRVGGEAEVDDLLNGEDSGLLRRVQKLYSVLLPGRTITGETLKSMIYADKDPDRDETDVKLNLAIDLALPPITRMPVEGLKELHEMIQRALQAA